jgi:hypothetical protein
MPFLYFSSIIFYSGTNKNVLIFIKEKELQIILPALFLKQ